MKFLAASFACLLASTAYGQSLSGIHLGDKIATASDMLGKPTNVEHSGPYVFEKWRLANNNDLSVTARRGTGQIVYLETDWTGYQTGAPSDFLGMTYGETTLHDIRTLLGSNGFTFADKLAAKTEGGIATFNCYGTTNDPSVVIVFVTKIGNDQFAAVQEKRLAMADAAKLVAIIITDANFVDSIWGRRKLFDNDYRPIQLK